MKLMKTMLCLGTLAVGIARAASRYSLTLSSSMWVGETGLKPGSYKVEIQGDKAVFTSGKNTAAAPASLVTGNQKFLETAVETGASSKIIAIDLGGTTTKIVLKSAESVPAGN